MVCAVFLGFLWPVWFVCLFVCLFLFVPYRRNRWRENPRACAAISTCQENMEFSHVFQDAASGGHMTWDHERVLWACPEILLDFPFRGCGVWRLAFLGWSFVLACRACSLVCTCLFVCEKCWACDVTIDCPVWLEGVTLDLSLRIWFLVAVGVVFLHSLERVACWRS